MIELTTTYLGLKLSNPVVVSASPLTEDIDNLRRMEDARAAAVVMHSLFEEQITLESHALDCQLSQPEHPAGSKIGPYFSSMIRQALQLEQAGADALVLFNRFYQPDFDVEHLTVAPNLTL